jgi:hypothetical protein
VQNELGRSRDDLDRAAAKGRRCANWRVGAGLAISADRAAAAQSCSQAQDQLRDSFQSLAGAALKTSNDEFLKLAHERLSVVEKSAVTEMSKKQQAFDELVSPIRGVLQQVDRKLGEVEKNRVETGAGSRRCSRRSAAARRSSRAETTEPRARTAHAHCAWTLGRNAAAPRGQNGQHARNACDFDEQSKSHTTENGRIRPICWCACPAAAPWSSTRRRRSRPISTRRKPPTKRRASRSWPTTRARCATT